MKSDYITRAKRLIQQLYNYIEDCKIGKDYLKAINNFNQHKSRHIQITSGMTRRVFICSDYVIKIDMPHSDFGTCEDEYEQYQQALDDGYEYLFAPITRFKYKDRLFYIMPRVRTLGYQLPNHDIEYYLTWDDWDYLIHHVDDIHDGNWGILHNQPVVFDYACRNYDHDDDYEEEEEEE